MESLFLITLVVDDYDVALDWYQRCLGFSVREDTELSPEKRWVVISAGKQGADILLAKASDDAQHAAIGKQTGGRVGFFLRTDDFTALYEKMTQAGVTFLEAPRDEPYGRVVQFIDLYGNKWDLLGNSA